MVEREAAHASGDAEAARKEHRHRMSETKQPPGSDTAADVETEIRRGRKFSLSDAIGRLGGGGMLKGASPVPPIEQTVAAVAVRWMR